MRSFGSSNVSHASVQFPPPEERKDAECNTDKIARSTQSVQVPNDIGLLPNNAGGNISNTQQASTQQQPLLNSVSLLKFLKNAAPVCEMLLQESGSVNNKLTASASSFSSGFTSFTSVLLCQGRTVQGMVANFI